MRALIIAAGLLAVTANSASAQFAPRPWSRAEHPYEQRYHSVCQEKANRLHDYERRAARDGRIDRHERQTIQALQYDLDRTCGRYRWHG